MEVDEDQKMADARYEERLKKSEKYSDPIEKDIYVRYGMDQITWRNAQRTDFPYSLVPTNIWHITIPPLALPIFTLIGALTANDQGVLLKTVIITVASSLVAYWLSQ